MTLPPAGSQKQGLFSREDYLAPPAIPTGQPTRDVLNTIWRKNEVFLDIGQYSIGSFVIMLWPQLLIAIWLLINVRDDGELFSMFSILFSFVIGIPLLMLLYSLAKPVSLPTRFNRQRREVCVPQKDGSYWIVPWETVVAQAIAMDSVGRHGKTTQGMLVVGFKTPDPNAKEGERDCSMGFSCGGGTTAMCLWECIRSYMEIGPKAVPDTRLGYRPYEETQIGSIITSLRKGDILDVLHGLFFVICLGTYFSEKLQNLKLAPPPDLTDPNIVEWSKPIPPEQWAKRSPEWDEAILQREVELAGEAAT
ncbi:hypothetical protein HMPREF3289_00655 [Pseudomonas sp. HMSC75E02]|uniref:hypothetical protein n=1 Tax=Pseudomonas sp. HMSC75E02 TaxID=1608908 RepID=UPI0008A86018|nr:hypothetical protein [Pseudomonas sp. HMSC75E02]OHS12701.1 hypothetical protein HMPREF3289_00655 [Pseudomonas sp. HMSC75E02]